MTELNLVSRPKGHIVHLVQNAKDLDKIEGLAPAHVKRAKAQIKKGGETCLSTITGETESWILKVKDGADATYSLQNYRLAGSKLCKWANGRKCEELTIVDESGSSDEHVLALAEGMALTNYQFLVYKTGKDLANSLEIVNVKAGLNKGQVEELSAIVSATISARDFVNEPVITLTATEYSKRMQALGKKYGFKVDVLKKSKLEELGMGGLLGVNKGSVEPPTFNIMEYKPKGAVNKAPIVLVGKGVVYDTGGYNIKTGPHMASMKCDMGGSAAVVGAMQAVSANKLPVHVIGLVPATDNRIDGKALVADDVITMYNGMTVEVLNTDAEGRLILADALHYAKKYKPELVIDLATLTGANAAITGPHGIAMCATDDTPKDALKTSGDEVYERILELPMWKEFHDATRSEVADIKNLGGKYGGGITAATFLHHFIDFPWVHLDIAGPAFMDDSMDYRPKGGTGVGVRVLYNFIKNRGQQ
ncbi:MAG: leucyl aminopeptidase [Bacteroidia bacterium]